MPSSDEIYRAIHGDPQPAASPQQPFPGLIVDLPQFRERQARAMQFAALYQPTQFKPMKALQAPTPPRRSGPPSCPVCAVVMRVETWGEIRCPICGRKP